MIFRARWALSVALAWSCGASAADTASGSLATIAAPGLSSSDSALYEVERSTRRDPQAAVLLSILADRYRSQSRFAEAELLYWRSLSIFREKLGMRDPNVGTAEHKLGQLHYLRGSYAAAEPHYRRALAVFERNFGPAHANVTGLTIELAGIYYLQAKYADAEAEYKRAIEIFRRSGDERSIEVARNGLAAVYLAQGLAVEAELVAAPNGRSGARTGPVVLRQRTR